MDTIKVKNTGPVVEADIPCPEEGGIVILTGENGAGKSEVQQGLEAWATHRGTITVRDGAERAEIEGLGLRLSRAVNQRHMGQLVVSSLEGKLSTEELVDPRIKDPLAADAARIKALIELTNRTVGDPVAFHELVGGQPVFDKYVPPEATKTTDLITLAGNVKRAFEKAARAAAEEAAKQHVIATGAVAAAGDTDVNLPSDEKELLDEQMAAVREEATLKEQEENRVKWEQVIAQTSISLTKTKSEYKGAERDSASLALVKLEDAEADALVLVEKLKAELAKAEAVLTATKHQRELAAKEYETAVTFEQTIADLQAVLDAESPPIITGDKLSNIALRISQAVQAVGTGRDVRKAREQLAKAEDARKEAASQELLASDLRQAALATDSVLSSAVESLESPLFVSGGRLKLITDRGEELFEDLSDGERCMVAARIAIKALREAGPRGLFNIPQWLWEGLNPRNKKALAMELEGTGVVAVVAEATDEHGVHARIFDPYELV